MPALLPLLSASSEVRSEITATKKPQRKLRRRNPPPSLSNNHQKLPSSAGSSVIGSRPTSSRSTRASIGGWFVSRKSVDAGQRDNVVNEIFPAVHRDGFVAGVYTPPASESPTSLRQEQRVAGRDDDPYQRQCRGPYQNSSENQPSLRRITHSGELLGDLRAAAANENPRSGTFSVHDEFLLPPIAPFTGQDRLSSDGTPILPPLPSFHTGDFGFDLSEASSSQKSFLRDDPDIRPPKNPARRKRDSTSPSIATSPICSAQSSPSRKSFTAEEYQRELDVDVRPSASPVHALTTEEPVVLPAAELYVAGVRNTDSPTLPGVVQEYQDDEGRNSFLGGWKLAMKNFESKGDKDSAGVSGWIQRRRGSFSAPRPPNASVSAHKSYAQEYKEFRSGRNSNSLSPSSTRSSTVDHPVNTRGQDARIDVAGTPHIAQPILSPGDPRKTFTDSVHQIEDLLDKKELESPRAPPSPRPSRNGSTMAHLSNPIIPPLTIRKPPSSSGSPSSSSSASSTSPNRGPGHKAHQKKKSISPLRNELSPSPVQEGMNSDKGKQRARSLSSSSGTLRSSRPPTPPKPVAKLFVICCRCKYWHDLPSEIYKTMVETGGATRCPYCLHGMETNCCEGYTCVVYMHQRHH